MHSTCIADETVFYILYKELASCHTNLEPDTLLVVLVNLHCQLSVMAIDRAKQDQEES